GVGEPVEQGRLAGIGVAGDRDGGHRAAESGGAAGVAVGLHPLDLALELGDARVDAATVELDLRLTGPAGPHTHAPGRLTAGLTGHRLTPATEARQEVLELRELDLGLALAALGVLGEDVEDQRGPVDDLDLDDVLEGAPLARRQ